MVGIEFNQQQIEAYKNGATMFSFPIEEDIFVHDTTVTFDNKTQCWFVSNYIKEFSSLQKDDEFFIQEDFCYIKGITTTPIYKAEIQDEKDIRFEDASQMQEHQSRFKDVCLNVEIKRVQDLDLLDVIGLGISKDWPTFSTIEWIEKYYNIKYKDNPYVFLYTVKSD